MTELKRVNFTLHIYASTDRHWHDWAENMARWLQAEINDNAREAGFPEDATVDVEDGGLG